MSTPKTPLSSIELVLADLDGVVYRGGEAIPAAVESLNLANQQLKVGFITNNAARRVEVVSEQLQGYGLNWAMPDTVISSPQAAVRMLKTQIPAGSKVLVVGGEGLFWEIENAGFEVTEKASDNPQAVVQGFAPEVTWTNLAEAAFAIQNLKIPWIATNQDWTIPREQGAAPGNGTLVSAVHTAVGILAQIAGKPETPIFEQALEHFGVAKPGKALVIGDRLDTDILGANRAGLKSALVLTGIDQAKQLLAAAPDHRPSYILDDLAELHLEYPQIRTSGNKYLVGDSIVELQGDEIKILDSGSNKTNLLRAACALIWESGRQIYGFIVPEELYS